MYVYVHCAAGLEITLFSLRHAQVWMDVMSGIAKKTALITGAAKRVGRAMAYALAADGYALALHCNTSRTQAEALAAEITLAGGGAVVVQADLADAGAVADLVDQAIAAVGPLGVLVNNASVFWADQARDTGPLWEAQMAVNLRAPVMLTQAFAAQGLPGAVIHLIDQKVWHLNAEDFSYTLSKSALWAATRTQALSFAPLVRVNAIAPGPLLPNAQMSDAAFAAEAEATPLQRPAAMDDVIAALRFFLNTTTVTGQMIAIDSGQHLL
jgi:NAD(P)-dependent dehydrogenase (short-subunit alcohol dehydrogenase family)